MSDTGFMQALDRVNFLVSQKLDTLLVVPDGPESWLFEAMRYSALSGGKGFRPLLCIASAAIFDVDEHRAARVAAAIECVHCY